MADNLNFNVGITINLTPATGLVAGATSTYTTTASTNAVINGKPTTVLTAQTAQPTPTTDASTGLAFNALAPNQCCSLVFGINAAGAIKMSQGPIIPTNIGVTTTVGSLILDPQFPGLPADFCPLGYCVARTAPSAAAWIPGTGSWTASGVSASTFQTVAQLPSRPQSS